MHIPVLLKEVLEIAHPDPGDFVIDGTLGGGGYAEALVARLGRQGKFVGLDWDRSVLEQVRGRLAQYEGLVEIKIMNANFADLEEILARELLGRANVLVLDLGLSSNQIENSGRGFSFLKNEPLLMTYSDEYEPLQKVLKNLSETEITKIIKEYSQDRYADRISKAIKERQRRQPIETSGDLVEVIKSAVPANYERGRLHPATRTFLAFRIYVNKELENLERVLISLPRIMAPKGRAIIVSFQSLEDKLVKNYFKNIVKSGQAEFLNKKPLQASRDEIKSNPRARSAKLRAITMK